jgi:multiple sugar transport system substrate-binding protein
MNRILGVFTALCIAAVLAVTTGCAKKQDGGSKQVEVTIWTHEDVNRTALEQRYIAEFQAANPGIKVNYVTYPSGKIKDILVAAFAANKGPDIFNLEINDAYPFIANGRVAPVDPLSAGYKTNQDIINAYMAGMLGPVLEGGKVYGLPLELTNWCVYLNKKILRDAGLDPVTDIPLTWEDIMAVSEKTALRNGEIITRRGFDFRYPYYLIRWLPMVEQLGGKLMTDDGKTAIVNDEAWLNALTFMQNFGPSGKNLGSPTYTDARKVFDNDQNEIAMSLSGLYQEQRMEAANPEFYNSDDWMVLPYPQWKDAKKVEPAHYYGHYYMVNAQKTTENQKAAWKLLGYMLSHSEEYLKEVAIIQPTKAVFESATFKGMPYSEVFKSDLEKGSIVYYAENSPKINTLLKTVVESVMLSGVSPEKALETLRRDLQAVISEQ